MPFLILLFILFTTNANAKDIIIKIADDVYPTVEKAFNNNVEQTILNYIKEVVIQHETFVAAIEASDVKKEEIKILNLGEIKTKEEYLLDNINWDNKGVIK